MIVDEPFSISGETYRWIFDSENNEYRIEKRHEDGSFDWAGHTVAWDETDLTWYLPYNTSSDSFDTKEEAAEDVEYELSLCRQHIIYDPSSPCNDLRTYDSEFCLKHDLVDRLKNAHEDDDKETLRKFRDDD